MRETLDAGGGRGMMGNDKAVPSACGRRSSEGEISVGAGSAVTGSASWEDEAVWSCSKAGVSTVISMERLGPEERGGRGIIGARPAWPVGRSKCGREGPGGGREGREVRENGLEPGFEALMALVTKSCPPALARRMRVFSTSGLGRIRVST